MKPAISLFLFLLLSSSFSQALTLDEYLNQVGSKHKSVQSLHASQEAAMARSTSQELELSPLLTLQGSYLDDKRPGGGVPFSTLTHNQVRTYSLGLGKKFVSGTQAQVSLNAQQINAESTLPGAPPIVTPAQSANAGVGISLSQSLWRDFFGNGTRTRLERQKVQSQFEKQGYDLQLQRLMTDAEGAYWELIYMQNEVDLRKQSLGRAQRIEGWIRKRVSNGIGDRAHSLNAQGLTATRELQLMTTLDNLKAAEKKVADYLELGTTEKLPPIKGDLDQVRPMNGRLMGEAGGRVLRMDSYLAVLEAKAKALVADEVNDSLRPDLVLSGSYQTYNSEANRTIPDMVPKAREADTPVAQAALTLTWALDGTVKEAGRRVARQEALAAALKKEKGLLDSESSWSEIVRRHQELSKKIVLAAKINQVQSQKAGAERDKLSKGRSITSEVVLAEQDAAEAELALSRLKAEQRKLEAESRLYMKVSNL